MMEEKRRPGVITPDDPLWSVGQPKAEELPPATLQIGGVTYRRPSARVLARREARRKRKNRERMKAAYQPKPKRDRSKKPDDPEAAARAVQLWKNAQDRERRWREKAADIERCKREAFEAMVNAGVSWRDLMRHCSISRRTLSLWMKAIRGEPGHEWPHLMYPLTGAKLARSVASRAGGAAHAESVRPKPRPVPAIASRGRDTPT